MEKRITKTSDGRYRVAFGTTINFCGLKSFDEHEIKMCDTLAQAKASKYTNIPA